MKYVYPKFDGVDLIFYRIGGSGLGNLLYPFFRSLVYSKKENLEIISPTFRSLKIGPYLRSEKQKRNYQYYYKNSITGFKRFILLIFKSNIKLVEGFGDGFNSLYGFESYLKEEFISLINKEVDVSKFKNAVCCHIRLGDFKKSKDGYISNNTRIPLSWYIDVINNIRKKSKDIKVFIFSDGTREEIKKILELENIELMTSENPAIDIVKLSASKIFIGSYSSFSFWGAFFSNAICIWHENIFNKNEFPMNANNYVFDSKKNRLIKQN